MIEKLINKGIKVIGNNDLEMPRQIVVIGTARGGTSMVAGVLAKLGLFMGDKAVPPVFEDVHLSELIESGDDVATLIAINAYKDKYKKFGWKRPSSIDNLDKVNEIFDRPKNIFIFKDIFSIANRNSISMDSDTIQGMENALNQYSKVISFIKKNEPDAMLVSYEKVMMNREEFVRQLDGFCNLDASENSVLNAIGFIDPIPADYLESSRINKAQGRLGGVHNKKIIFGWARYVYKKEPATVEIFINDSFIGATIANKDRADLRGKFNQACAYSYDVPDDLTIKKSDVVTARVKGEIRELDNSPVVI